MIVSREASVIRHFGLTECLPPYDPARLESSFRSAPVFSCATLFLPLLFLSWLCGWRGTIMGKTRTVLPMDLYIGPCTDGIAVAEGRVRDYSVMING